MHRVAGTGDQVGQDSNIGHTHHVLSVIMELEAVVPSRSRRRTAYNVKYTVTRFELLDFVNRERGRDRVYICGRSGEYFVTYPARHLFFIHVLILQPVFMVQCCIFRVI